MMNGWTAGPLDTTQVRLSVEPLLRNTSLGPRMRVVGSAGKKPKKERNRLNNKKARETRSKEEDEVEGSFLSNFLNKQEGRGRRTKSALLLLLSHPCDLNHLRGNGVGGLAAGCFSPLLFGEGR